MARSVSEKSAYEKEIRDLKKKLKGRDTRIKNMQDIIDELKGNDYSLGYSDSNAGNSAYNSVVNMLCDMVTTVLDNLGEYGFDLEIAKEELIETIENC